MERIKYNYYSWEKPWVIEKNGVEIACFKSKYLAQDYLTELQERKNRL